MVAAQCPGDSGKTRPDAGKQSSGIPECDIPEASLWLKGEVRSLRHWGLQEELSGQCGLALHGDTKFDNS